MQTKGFIVTIATALVLICIFYLSFSFVTSHYEGEAQTTALKAAKIKSPDMSNDTYRKAYNDYISGIEKKKVWLGYTYQEVREKQLGLGLDLKGGMNVTLQISVPDILKVLSGNNQDKKFNDAIAKVDASSENFVGDFCKNYKQMAPEGSLVQIFRNRVQKIKDNPQATDAEVETYLKEEVDKMVDNSYKVLRTRIDRFGVVAPNIQKLQSTGRILLELPGIKEPERVTALLQSTANLQFFETYKGSEIMADIQALSNAFANSGSAAPADTTATAEAAATDSTAQAEPAKAETAKADAKKSAAGKTLMELLGGADGESPAIGHVAESDTAAVNKIIYSDLAKKTLKSDLKLCWTNKPESRNQKGGETFALVALKCHQPEEAVLTGDVVTSATSEYDNLQGNQVSMVMNDEGARKWSSITAQNLHRAIAIVLDDQVYSYPNVNSQIDGGRSQITGNFTPEEASDLANVLESGKMDAKVNIVSQSVIGPSLGQESIRKGLISFLVALVLLMIFMMCVYGIKAGMIANLGLLFNLFFTAGILASFQSVLTLPGIAGIVLALGMAVDANVLIFERIKEELRAGKALKAAVADGYGNAFSAIFDSNLTSIITGIILAILGTGPIKGFAVTTIVGICCSFFTAVYATRVILEWLINKGWYANISFTTPWTRHMLENVKFDFMGKRKMSFTCVAIVVIAIIAMFFIPGRGLSLGIDFSGGRNYVVQFDQPVQTELLRTAVAAKLPGANTSVITIDNNTKVRVSTNYKIDDPDSKKVDKEIEDALFESLKGSFKNPITRDQFDVTNTEIGIQQSEQVGPTIASDMTRAASWAVFFALLAMAIYILIRFRNVAFSVGALAAVAFTAFVVIGFYTLHGIFPFSMEIDQTFIAAILTVIGYQVNDTVVVFDRVREYRKLYPKQNLYDTFNNALCSTLARTTMTSITTLLVLFVIFFLGGESIRSFIFAMILGVIIGTCSSLFIASPVAYAIAKRGEKKDNK
ncbi:MAG: protein translocase subunit SecDF [Muribaculaceae bacterium]|nr:protein translocase subunit SecDF [Muribaculaceae bacterium]